MEVLFLIPLYVIMLVFLATDFTVLARDAAYDAYALRTSNCSYSPTLLYVPECPHLPAAAGMLSSFDRVSGKVNIPVQFNFSALAADRQCIEIARGTPMAQYVHAVLPAIKFVPEEM